MTKIALVTGAARGIGLATTHLFLEQGWRVAMIDRDTERQALNDALAGRLTDVFRVFEPASAHWSWWDYRSGAWDRDQGWRIDHIYLSEDLLQCATGCIIDKNPRGNIQPSDHAPVVVNLAWDEENGESEDEWN